MGRDEENIGVYIDGFEDEEHGDKARFRYARPDGMRDNRHKCDNNLPFQFQVQPGCLRDKEWFHRPVVSGRAIVAENCSQPGGAHARRSRRAVPPYPCFEDVYGRWAGQWQWWMRRRKRQSWKRTFPAQEAARLHPGTESETRVR